MAVLILDESNDPVGTLPPAAALTLARAPTSPESLTHLDDLRRRRLRLRCECGRILHVVQKDYAFLRRNPNQPDVGRECPLCESAGGHNRPAAQLARSQPPSGISLVLGTRLHPQKSEPRERDDRDRGRAAPGQKYQRAFGVLFQVMKRARFTSLPAPLPWDDMWRRLHDVLSGINLHPRSPCTLADFAWMPGRLYTGGLRGLNQRLVTLFRHPELQPEGWVFGTATEMPTAGRLDLWPTSRQARDASAARQQPAYPPYKLEAPPHNVSAVGRTGPFLVFAICSANRKDDPQFAKPVVHRLLLQSIAAEDCPVPVESGHERDVVALLQSLRVKYYKPVFDTPDGLRPDFVLPDHRVLLEVQGIDSADYREHKREIHARLRRSPTFPGYDLLLYSPNDGETLRDFAPALQRRLSLG